MVAKGKYVSLRHPVLLKYYAKHVVINVGHMAKIVQARKRYVSLLFLSSTSLLKACVTNFIISLIIT